MKRAPVHFRLTDRKPIMYESGRLYFMLEMWDGRFLYASIRGSRKRIGYWIDRVLDITDAGMVTHIISW